jgi:multiple sugar transport system ATP-binding protein
MIYVTHDQIEALTLADRIAVMRKGVIEQFATPHEIYHRPANTFIAGFIGSPTMNFLKGRLEGDGGAVRFAGEGGVRFDVSTHPGIAAHAGKPVILGIRPEHIALGAADGQVHGGRAEVKVVEPMGADTVIWIDFAGDLRAMRIAGDPPVAAGDTVAFHFPPERVSFFEAESGVRL